MVSRVELTVSAQLDLNAILTWLREQEAGDAGLSWFRGLRQAIGSLESLPRRCGLAREDVSFPFEIRQMLYGRRPHMYRILFTIRDEVVTVLHVRHARRMPVV